MLVLSQMMLMYRRNHRRILHLDKLVNMLLFTERHFQKPNTSASYRTLCLSISVTSARFFETTGPGCGDMQAG